MLLKIMFQNEDKIVISPERAKKLYEGLEAFKYSPITQQTAYSIEHYVRDFLRPVTFGYSKPIVVEVILNISEKHVQVKVNPDVYVEKYIQFDEYIRSHLQASVLATQEIRPMTFTELMKEIQLSIKSLLPESKIDLIKTLLYSLDNGKIKEKIKKFNSLKRMERDNKESLAMSEKIKTSITEEKQELATSIKLDLFGVSGIDMYE